MLNQSKWSIYHGNFRNSQSIATSSKGSSLKLRTAFVFGVQQHTDIMGHTPVLCAKIVEPA